MIFHVRRRKINCADTRVFFTRNAHEQRTRSERKCFHSTNDAFWRWRKENIFSHNKWWIRDFSFHAWSEFSSYVLVFQLTKAKQQASLSIPAPSFINVKHWSFSLPASTSSLSTFRFENFERVPHEGSHEIVDFSGRINIFHSKVSTPHHISPHLTCKNWGGWQLKPSKKLHKFTRHVTETIVR